jgi:putative Holliday junction resolvase
MKLVSIDYGRARIGMAVTDESGACVRSLATLHQSRESNIVKKVCTVVESHRPQAVVIGLPLGGDEQETPMSREVRTFGARIAKITGCAIHYIDESFTSQQAQRMLRNRPKKKRRDKAALDRIAACLILEEFLKEKKPKELPDSGSVRK